MSDRKISITDIARATAISDGDYVIGSIGGKARRVPVTMLGANAIINEVIGSEIKISDNAGGVLHGLVIRGKTVQNGSPTPDTPIDCVNVTAVNVGCNEQNQVITLNAPTGVYGLVDKKGNEWWYDEVDFGACTYTRRVKKIVLDGSQNGIYESGISMYSLTVADMLPYVVGQNNALCSHYPFGRYANADMPDRAFKVHTVTTSDRRAIYIKDLRFTSIDTWNAFLRENPVTVIYPLETPEVLPIDEVLSEAEVQAYLALAIHAGDITLSNDALATMVVKYTIDTKTYIDEHASYDSCPIPVVNAWEQRLLERIDQTMIPVVALRDLPKVPNGYTAEGETLTGINYSSSDEINFAREHLVGCNVSLSTYYSALKNPASIMYTRDDYQDDSTRSTYYGISCSAFVSYVCGWKEWRWNAKIVSELADGTLKGEVLSIETVNDLFQIRRGDLVQNTVVSSGNGDHVRIVQDVVHEIKTGRLIGFNVAESAYPYCRTVFYNLDKFLAQMSEEQPYRVIRLDDSEYGLEVVPIEYSKSVYPDKGDGGKYTTDEEVWLYIPNEAATHVTYSIDGGESVLVALAGMEQATVNDVTVYRFTHSGKGVYSIAVNTASDDPCTITITEATA